MLLFRGNLLSKRELVLDVPFWIMKTQKNHIKKDCFCYFDSYVCCTSLYLLTYIPIIVFMITPISILLIFLLLILQYSFTNQVVFFKACDRLDSNKCNFH